MGVRLILIDCSVSLFFGSFSANLFIDSSKFFASNYENSLRPQLSWSGHGANRAPCWPKFILKYHRPGKGTNFYLLSAFHVVPSRCIGFFIYHKLLQGIMKYLSIERKRKEIDDSFNNRLLPKEKTRSGISYCSSLVIIWMFANLSDCAVEKQTHPQNPFSHLSKAESLLCFACSPRTPYDSSINKYISTSSFVQGVIKVWDKVAPGKKTNRLIILKIELIFFVTDISLKRDFQISVGCWGAARRKSIMSKRSGEKVSVIFGTSCM